MKLSLVLRSFVLLIFPVSLGAEEPSADPVQINIISSQKALSAGDVLHLGLAIENTGKEPATLHGIPTDQWQTAEWQLVDTRGGEVKTIRSLYSGRLTIVNDIVLRPGERVLVGDLFVVDERNPAWSSGEYRVKCIISATQPKRKVQSDFVLTVEEGAGVPGTSDADILSAYLTGGNKGVALEDSLGKGFRPRPSQFDVIEYSRVKEAIRSGDTMLIEKALPSFHKHSLEMHVLARQRFLVAIGIMLTERKIGMCDEARKIEPFVRIDYYERRGLVQAIEERCGHVLRP